MFNDNSKKILRYENLSNDLVAMQQQHQLNNSNNNNSNINSNKSDYATNYNNNITNNTNNSYGYNVITGSKKY